MSSVISNHHRVSIENFGLPLNALNGSDQDADTGGVTDDDHSFSPALFSPISFSSHNHSFFSSSPTYPRQKSNSVSPINSPTSERRIGGRTYGVQTLADTYHVTNSDDFGLLNSQLFGERLRPDSYQHDVIPAERDVIPAERASQQSDDDCPERPAHEVWGDKRLPTPTPTATATATASTSPDRPVPLGSGSIRIISHSPSTVEMSVSIAHRFF